MGRPSGHLWTALTCLGIDVSVRYDQVWIEWPGRKARVVLFTVMILSALLTLAQMIVAAIS
jgi:hypothetical protein